MNSWEALRAGDVPGICVRGGQPIDTPAPPTHLFPGSFNPLHHGHLEISNCVREQFGGTVDFEISILNVDKPELSDEQLSTRIQQFAPHQSLWLTKAPTFYEKSLLFPGVTFVVGVDTVARIADPKYYEAAEPGVLAVCQHFHEQQVRFLVFGRLYRGKFSLLSDLNLPEPLGRLCHPVSEKSFRADVSSTELRRLAGD